MLVEERPWRNHREERQARAAQASVERLVDVLSGEADQEGKDARGSEEDGCKELGNTLAFEVLVDGARC